MVVYLGSILASACWGSFLNVVAYRLVVKQSLLLPFSYCPQCKQSLAWYDMIPLISWSILRRKCRTCKHDISILYPFIELLSAILFPALWYRVPLQYYAAYFIFFSALLVTVRTDLEFMLISRFVSIFLIPIGLGFSYMHMLPITIVESILGSIGGYTFLYITAKLFLYLTGKEGMGQGDFDLLAFIGSFLGPFGTWITLLIGSITGSLVGLFCIIILNKHTSYKLPFGPFLALGAIGFVLFTPIITSFL